jgi:hypothetical protein
VGAGSVCTTDIGVDDLKILRTVAKPLELLLHKIQMFCEHLLLQHSSLAKEKRDSVE